MANVSCKKQLFGLNKKQVNTMIQNYDSIIRSKDEEISKLKKEHEDALKQLELLQHRVNINDRTNEEIARLALKEASTLIEKAKKNANMILKESLDYVHDLNKEVEGYKDQAIAFRANIEKMSKELMETIDNSEVFILINEENELVDESE